MNDQPKVSIGHIEISDGDSVWSFDTNNVRVLPTREFVMFPNVTFPVSLGRESSKATAEFSEKNHALIGMFCQRDSDVENPVFPADIYEYGVLAKVIKIFELPDGHKTAIIKSGQRVKITGEGSVANSVKVKIEDDFAPQANDEELSVIAELIRSTAVSLFRRAEGAPQDLTINMESIEDAPTIINLVATHTPFPADVKIQLLSIPDLKKRADELLRLLNEQESLMKIREEITDRTRQNMNEMQRQNFLQNQLETIKQELYGSDDDDITRLQMKAEEVAMPETVRKVFDRELQKLTRFNPQSPDYAVQYSYLDVLLSLPWGVYSPTNDDFVKAKDILNSHHYGLDKVKERIVEQIAVMLNNPTGNNPIICLVGPPGVGKTSLGKSVAEALGRKYQRVSLGGVHDESEIRGHRRTYIGAMPGRIIDAMRRAGTSNPVLLLDEVDKIASDARTNPEAAMLEVLDPEQNCHFHDNYVDVDFDLSKVLFIATANTLSTLSRPLLDRMEIIDISGYLMEEKIEIAKRHLIPRLLENHGLSTKSVNFSDEALQTIIEGYTSESGVRQLEKNLAKIIRKNLVRKLSKERVKRNITPEVVKAYLGVQIYDKDMYEGNDHTGVVTGLAWTSVGGEILFVESSLSKSKTPKLTLTGNLGDVMKESAQIALEYVKAHSDALGIDPRIFEQYSLHIHVPEGAIPKDGPSAGITMVTSIVSVMTGRKVKPALAMTGEITLRGKVLPVGGIKEKILAAKRAGITTIILSQRNRKNIEEIEERYIKGLKFIYVDDISEVIANALCKEKETNCIVLE